MLKQGWVLKTQDFSEFSELWISWLMWCCLLANYLALICFRLTVSFCWATRRRPHKDQIVELEDEREKKRKAEEDANAAADSAELKKKKRRVWGGTEDMGWWKGRVEDEDQGCGRILSIGLIKNLRLQSLGVQELMITKWKTPASNKSVNVRPGLLTCPNSYRPSRGSLPSCARKSRRERSKGNQSGFKNSYSPTHRQGF